MTYIRRLEIQRCRNIDELTIDLSPPEASGREFMHLILTGPNGSGKTGVLSELERDLQRTLEGRFGVYQEEERQQRQIANLASELTVMNNTGVSETAMAKPKERLAYLEGQLKQFTAAYPIRVYWSTIHLQIHELLQGHELFFFVQEASRTNPVTQADGPKKIALNLQHSRVNDRFAAHLLQYLVNKRTEMAYASSDKDAETAAAIEAWLERTQKRFNRVMGLDLEWIFDRRNFDYHLRDSSGYTFNLQQLSDGHAAALSLLGDILMRVELIREEKGDRLFEPAGIVVVDELETHLHLELQEQILPALTEFFPKVQFIVATHSPAVIASIDGAVVCDLGDRSFTLSDDLRGQRYGAIMTDHFKIESDFDAESTQQLKDLITLSKKSDRSEDEEAELKRKSKELADRGHAMAQEIWMRLQYEPRLAEQRRRLEASGG